MIECQLGPFTVEMNDMIPRQRAMVEQLIDAGVIITYTLAADRSKLWIVMQADNESELMTYIDSLPMMKYGDYTYNEIMFHDYLQFIPTISLN